MTVDQKYLLKQMQHIVRTKFENSILAALENFRNMFLPPRYAHRLQNKY